MRRGRCALWACVAALVAAPLFPQDGTGLDRLTRREHLLGWEAIGRVDIVGGGFCTGTLVATQLVLTAAHCVFDEKGTPIDAGRMMFRAGYADGTSIAEVAVRRTVVVPEYRGFQLMTADQLKLDVAILELAEVIPAAVAAPFLVASPGNGARVSVISYAAGREEALSWQRVCSVLGRDRGLIAVDCDVTFGASGAPVLDRSAGRARIVSIISAGYDRGGNTVALGMELPAIVSRLKTLLRQDRVLSTSATVTSRPFRRMGFNNTSRDTGARFVKP